MQENPLKALWRDDKTAINGWVTIPSGFAAEVMARQDWDSGTVDMQHGILGYQAAVECLTAISTTDKVPLVRVPWNEPSIIMRMLDAGALGVICPMVNTRQQAEQLVAASRYAPDGGRSIGPVRPLLTMGPEYVSRANQLIQVFAMIETPEAMENLDDIMTTPGLDGIYIGPSDLAMGLGFPPAFDPDNTTVMQAIDGILSTAEKHGLVPGIHCPSGGVAWTMSRNGFRLVSVANDWRILSTAAQDEIAAARGGD
jgi:4-hydroxy-2-oxoheptanedioate aldolase